MNNDDRSLLISIPCRGRSLYLDGILAKIAATKSARTTVVVVSNGAERFPDPGFEGIHVVHIGDIPTIPAAVNFAWYAMRQRNSILVKLDNDIMPPDDWEREIIAKSEAAELGGFLCSNEFEPTPPFTLRGHAMRRPHESHTWGIPFIYGGFLWLAPQLAEQLQYVDERFVRSDDGDLGERVSRIAGMAAAYSADKMAIHLSPGPAGSTEPSGIIQEMYEACDLLIKALPKRAIAQDTIWSACLTREKAADIVRSRGELPRDIVFIARELLRAKLGEAFSLIGRSSLVDKIFERA